MGEILNPNRDLRIDLFRGLALASIYVDHIPFDRLSYFTIRNFGFINAADVFVLLAGISFALAYAPRLKSGGPALMAERVGRRILTIYGAHILLFVAGLMLLIAINRNSAADLFLAAPSPTWAGYAPMSAIAAALTLELQPPFFDILPLYVVLLALGIPLLLAMTTHWRATIVASVAIWLFAELCRVNLPSLRSGAGWYFDPLSWQVVFSAGLGIGLLNLRRESLQYAPWLSALCVAYIIAAFLVFVPCHRYGVNSTYCYFEMFSRIDLAMDRQTPWRLLNTLAWVYLVARHLPRNAGWLTHPAVRIFTRMGRHSLAVFCLGTLLTLAVRASLDGEQVGRLTQITVNVLGIGALALAAYLLDHVQRRPARGLRIGA